MAEKYYITNGCQVIGAVGTAKKAYAPVTGSLSLGARFKYAAGNDFIRKELGSDPKWSLQKVYDSNSKKNYVITTATNFAGDKGTITNLIDKAKVFRNPAEAESYIKNHRELANSFGEAIIINDKFEKVEKSAAKTFTDEQLQLIGVNRKPARIVLSKAKRVEIYNRSNQRCAICGKPLRYDEMSVDHTTPLSRGGENSIDNLRCTCQECNMLKGDRLDSEMYKGLSNIISKAAFDDPGNESWNSIIRAMVRGTIKQHVRE